jgi:peptide/nickel transport system substrate-binding protein
MIRFKGPKSTRGLAAAAVLSSLALGSVAPQVQARGVDATASNTLTIGWAPETVTLDPGANSNNPDIWVQVNIYDQLVRVAPDGNTIVPDLATAWDISKDGKTYTFHLRKGVKFTDGTPLTSADVKADLLRTAQPKRGWSFLYTAIKSIDTPDANTVTIHLTHPWGPFLSDMSLFAGGIFPAAYLKKVGDAGLAQHPVGTGPYMLDKWVKGQYLRLKKNPNYWDAAKYPMQYVEYDYIPNDNTKLLKLEGGELDVDYNLPFNLVASLKNNSAVQVEMNPSTRTQYLAFQTQMKPFDEVNVRQAISHAIDRAAIVKAVTYGLTKPANSFIPAGALDYDPNIPVPTYDLKLARQYLAKSSVPHGFNMTFEVGSGVAVANEIAQIVQQELKPLGINVTIKQEDSTTLFADQNAGKYHFIYSGWTNDIPDPDELVSYAMDYVHGGSNAYNTYYNNPEAIKLSQQAEQSTDPAKRKSLYYQIQQIWAKDAPFLALFYQPYINGVSSKVHGFSENPLGYFNLMGVTKS